MLYSYKGQEPKELPNRIVFPDGNSKTDRSTFTAQDIIDAGYIEVEDKPILTGDMNSIYWNSSELVWVINYKTPEQKFQQAYNDWKLTREENVNSILVEFQIGLNNDNQPIYTQIQGDEVSQDRMNRAINVLPDDTTTVAWLDIDNTVIQLNKADLKAILYNASVQQSALWNLNRPVLEDYLNNN